GQGDGADLRIQRVDHLLREGTQMPFCLSDQPLAHDAYHAFGCGLSLVGKVSGPELPEFAPVEYVPHHAREAELEQDRHDDQQDVALPGSTEASNHAGTVVGEPGSRPPATLACAPTRAATVWETRSPCIEPRDAAKLRLYRFDRALPGLH